MTWVLLCEALARSIPGGSNLCATSPTWSCLAPLGQGLVPWSKGQSPYVWCLVVSVPIILLVDCNHWPLLKATLSLCQCRSVPKRLELVWAWCTYQTPAILGIFMEGIQLLAIRVSIWGTWHSISSSSEIVWSLWDRPAIGWPWVQAVHRKNRRNVGGWT